MTLYEDPINLKEEASTQLREAIVLYTEWGADGKVALIRAKHPDLDL